MNEQTSKKIIFNKSTLLSLKAELLKKQDEVYEKKQKPQHKVENFKPAKVTDIEKTTKVFKRTLKDNLNAVDTEELEACRKSKLALEKKTELYEHLSDGVGTSQLAGRFLVDFNTKKQGEVVKHIPDVPTVSDVGQDTEYKDGENEWSEFTDCLGRTRKCHVSDLEMYKKRDRDLMRIMYKDTTGNEDEALENTESQNIVEKPLLVQKTNDYLHSLREKWEEKEKELLAKDKDIHYQDILFDEARIHGVGYYAFSTDETERQKQMEELLKRRQETLRAQQEAERARTKRDQLMAARVAAARARQRARAGLPPEEPQVNQDDFTKRLLEFLTQQKNEADFKATEEEKRAKEEMEKERQKLREAYVREWDLGKDGVEDKVKKFREMTQEEYVEQQRDKRIHEFAPPQTSTSEKSNYSFDDTGRMVNPKGTVPIKTWADVRPKAKTPTPPDIGDLSDFTEHKGLYFSTATTSETTVKYRNFVKAQDPIHIDNELSDEEPVDDNRVIDKRKHDSHHSEIAPPPTYDYYGPVPKQARSQKPFESNIREAYAQGAKSLEPKSSNRKLPQHYDFTFD